MGQENPHPQPCPAGRYLFGPGRKLALLAIAVICTVVAALSASSWPVGSAIRQTIEWVGVALILVAIFGRTWCAVFIGGNKNTTLVTAGPYSVMRNPLFLFSILGATGVAAQAGMLVVAVGVCVAVGLLFLGVIREEEDSLRRAFGARYLDYLGRVPRLLPYPFLWRNPGTIDVRPKRVVVTFLDGLFFLLAIPAADLIASLQASEILPTLLRLP